MGAWRQPGGLSVFCFPPPPDPNPAHHHQRPPAPHTPLPHPLIWHLLSASLLPPASLDVLSGDLRPPRLPDKRRWCGSWGSREIVRGRTLRAHPVAGAKLIRTLQPTPERREGVWQRARRLRTTHPSCHIRHIRVTPFVVRATSFQGCLRPAAALDKAGAAGPLASPRRRRSADAAASPAEARGGTAIQPDLASTVIAPRAGTHSSPFPSHFSHLNLRSPLPSLLFPHLALMTPPRPLPNPLPSHTPIRGPAIADRAWV